MGGQTPPLSPEGGVASQPSRTSEQLALAPRPRGGSLTLMKVQEAWEEVNICGRNHGDAQVIYDKNSF